MIRYIISLEMSKGENMKRMSIKEFKTKSNIEIIEELMKVNNGYVTSKLISEFGIHIDSNKIEDNYFVFSLELPNIIYSHMTALYFHGLSIKAPDDKFDITVPNNYFNYKLKNHNVFYVDKEVYSLGLTEVETPFGNKVRVYDIERCICDVIRSKNRMDSEHVKYSIREYIKSKDKDLVKLSKYADKIGVKEEVMNLLEWFYE